jgi:mannose-6-phosphate isomerase-like protein (cupin superfamily)
MTKEFPPELIMKNVARFASLHGSAEAYVDSRLPNCHRKKFNIVGFGVTENETHPDLLPNIALPAAGFNVGMLECEAGNGTAPHSHDTEEFFMPLIGNWRVFWLDGETERHVDLAPFDSVMWPIGCFRWFRYMGEGKGRLLTIIGGPAGKVTYLPGHEEAAAQTGIERRAEGTIMVDAAE